MAAPSPLPSSLTAAAATDSFDERFLARFHALQATPGLFRNPHYARNRRRVLPGALGVVAQFNEHHLVNKRPTGMANPTSARRAFDAQLFNFTKANPAELVCGMDVGGAVAFTGASAEASTNDDAAAEPLHAVFVNPSPILLGHSLLVPSVRSCAPQELSAAHIAVALRLLRSASNGHAVLSDGTRALTATRMCLGFNSLGGWASVNHCHFHAFWADDMGGVDHRTPFERSPLTPAARGKRLALSLANEWALPALVFSFAENGGDTSAAASVPLASSLSAPSLDTATDAERNTNLALLAHAVAQLTTHLLDANIPHQLFACQRVRDRPVVYVWPRRFQV